MSKFCLLCLKDRVDELINFNQVLDARSIVDKLKIVHPEINPSEIKCQKYMCRNCHIELNSCLSFKEKYDKSYNHFKFYKEKLQSQLVAVNEDDIKIEEEIIYLEEDKQIIQELINSEAPVEVNLKPKENKFPCFKCKAILPCEQSLNHHMEMHNKLPIITSVKSKSTSSKRKNIPPTSTRVNLVKHSKLCSRRLRSKKDHTFCATCKEVDVKNGLRMCQLCNIIFSNQSELDKHVCQIKFQCHECLKKFISKTNLDKHKLTHLRKFVCSFCPKRFISDSLLREHLKVHENTIDFQCEKCQKSFQNQRNLKRHLIAHAFQCGSCDRSFRSKKMLLQHQTKH